MMIRHSWALIRSTDISQDLLRSFKIYWFNIINFTFDIWQVTSSDKWLFNFEFWQLTFDFWYLTFDIDMTLIWHWYDIDMKLIWNWYDIDIKFLWQWYDIDMALIWHWYVIDMSLIWHLYDIWYLTFDICHDDDSTRTDAYDISTSFSLMDSEIKRSQKSLTDSLTDWIWQISGWFI